MLLNTVNSPKVIITSDLYNFVLTQDYLKPKLVRKFYGRHHDLFDPYNVAVSSLISVSNFVPIQPWLVSVCRIGPHPKPSLIWWTDMAGVEF